MPSAPIDEAAEALSKPLMHFALLRKIADSPNAPQHMREGHVCFSDEIDELKAVKMVARKSEQFRKPLPVVDARTMLVVVR